MKLRGLEILYEFSRCHPEARNWINNWVADVKNVTWQTPQDVKNRHSSASIVADNIVFFNVKGNDYRMQVKIYYQSGDVLIRWIGTHEEYTKKFVKGK